jgi:hypothetical protein
VVEAKIVKRRKLLRREHDLQPLAPHPFWHGRNPVTLHAM